MLNEIDSCSEEKQSGEDKDWIIAFQDSVMKQQKKRMDSLKFNNDWLQQVSSEKSDRIEEDNKDKMDLLNHIHKKKELNTFVQVIGTALLVLLLIL